MHGAGRASCERGRVFIPIPPATIRVSQSWKQADVAQLVEQLTRNEQVVRSSRIIGSMNLGASRVHHLMLLRALVGLGKRAFGFVVMQDSSSTRGAASSFR